MDGNLDDERVAAALLPKLRAEAVIARGSFGVVYRARQLAVARDVAVKVLHTGMALEPTAGRLFRDEIRAIGTIDHQNVVRVFDADETADGRQFFVMELLHGPTLQELGRVAPARAIHLVGQLLDGLAAVHAAGHIHGDIKPANAVVCGEPGEERVVLIDFGFSRSRHPDRPAEAVGGTRAYMAPEQLRSWQLDARSDVFSAALVLIKLLTGRHRSGDERCPPLDGITDPALRHALERALAEDPADRPSAADFARALRGGAPDEVSPPGPPPPFRELAPLTERDRGRLCGRAADVLRLARRVETARAVVLTAPSGTGKTSLLRAGVIPYLDAAGRRHVYLACEPGAPAALAALISPGTTKLADALARRAGEHLVVILDQLEVALGNGEAGDLLASLLGSDVAMVLGVREDFVARLLAASSALADGVPQVRLPPLDRVGATEALVSPLAEHDVTLAPDLLARLLDDLAVAGREMGLESDERDGAIYPPHLQLTGTALFDALRPGEQTISVAHYEALGGFASIVGEHLDRTLGELAPSDREIARELFLALVTSSQTRAVRSEVELVEAIGARHGDIAARRVLGRLESRRLVARTSGIDGVPSWSLVHDTLVARIEAWVTVHDLDRRRAAEIVRFHLRHSERDSPLLLSARQLRSFAKFPGLVDELEAGWRRRPNNPWTPRGLEQRSRKQVRYRRAVIASATVAMLGLTAILIASAVAARARSRRSEALQKHQAELRIRNIGRIDLTIEPFEWRRGAGGALETVTVPASSLPSLDWQLFDPAEGDPDAPGVPVSAELFRRGQRQPSGDALLENEIEVRGGEAFLSISGRGRPGETCAPSSIPLRHLRGHVEYVPPRPIKVRVPTCAASAFDMVAVPEGPFIWSGLGEPPTSSLPPDSVLPEQPVTLKRFEIDRTEITNEAFAVFAQMASIHDIEAEPYTDAFAIANGPAFPRSNLDWFDARAYCRYMGKDLPTSRQWQKALRGGLTLPSGERNPAPRRNVPWIDAPPSAPGRAGIADEKSLNAQLALGEAVDPRHPYPVGAFPADVSPYGVVDLAGSVQEWILDAEDEKSTMPARRRSRLTRGGNWFDTTERMLDAYMTIENARSPHLRLQFMGARCAR